MGKDLAWGAGEGQAAEQGEAQSKGGDKSAQHVILRPGCRQAGGGVGGRHEPSLPTGESHHFLNMILSKMAHPILPARQTAVQMHRFKNLFSALTLQKLKSPFPL